MGGKRVAAYEAGTLGRDGVRWLLHLVEGAGVVPLAAILIRAFSFDDHCVVGEVLDCEINANGNLPSVVFVIVGVLSVEFVSTECPDATIITPITGVVGVDCDVEMRIDTIIKTPFPDEFCLADA